MVGNRPAQCNAVAGFVAQVLSSLDATRATTLRGWWLGAFATAPVLNQVYERHTYDEMIKAKYGGSGYTPVHSLDQ